MTSSVRVRQLLAAGVAALSVLVVQTAAQGASSKAKAGAACTKAGTTSSGLLCTRKGSKLVWAAAPSTTTTTTTAAAASSSAAATTGSIDGAWKASSKSVVGYRVKETLFGQSTEGVGRTSALTGSMTISGTSASAVILTADLTKLKSDDNRRDGQVQRRLLETAKFPTAILKTIAPIDFATVPANGAVVNAKVTAALTLHGVTKTVNFDVQARRNGAVIEVAGSMPITFADYNIENPSNAAASVGTSGTLEFAVTFTR